MLHALITWRMMTLLLTPRIGTAQLQLQLHRAAKLQDSQSYVHVRELATLLSH
jgi:hypothetical protein